MPTYPTLRDRERLAELIEASDLTLPAIAKAIGISRQRLWKLRKGEQPNLEDAKAKALEELLGARPGELFALDTSVDVTPFVPEVTSA